MKMIRVEMPADTAMRVIEGTRALQGRKSGDTYMFTREGVMMASLRIPEQLQGEATEPIPGPNWTTFRS